MKKLFCLILSMLLVAALLPACTPAAPAETTAPTEAPKPHTMSVGFGRTDITPSEPVPMGGLHDVRISDGIKDRIYATCVAFTDENDNTMILFSIEALYAYDVMLFGASKIARETGVPIANIMIGTTHSHASPDVTKESTYTAIERYNKFLQEQMVEAAKQALADRKPAKMQFTTVQPQNINSIRHYIMSDGSYAGDNFGSFGGGRTIVSHVRDVDNNLQLVKFVREGGKDIIMMNWQGHPSGHGDHRTKIMSWPCTVTGAVEEGLGVHCMYVMGASGNVNNSSRIAEEKVYKTYEERALALAKYVINAKDYVDAETGPVQVLAQSAECYAKGGGSPTKVDLDVYAIGDFAVAAAPYEMYCENGEAVKAGSPFKMTFVSSCTNGRGSYIPSISTWDYNNKPDVVYGISKTQYEPGAAEILESTFVSMLKELKNAQ